MNFRIALALSLTMILASSCVSSSLGPATPTPIIMPRLDPSPTPSDSALPLTCQITDLNVYINEGDGYCFAYPTRFVRGDQPFDKPNVHGPAVDEGSDPVHAMLVVETKPSTGQPLREEAESFLSDFSVVESDTLTWRQVAVGGETGLSVEPVPVMLSWRIVFVQHDGNLFRLMYWPVDVPEARTDLDELTQTTLGSFAFTK